MLEEKNLNLLLKELERALQYREKYYVGIPDVERAAEVRKVYTWLVEKASEEWGDTIVKWKPIERDEAWVCIEVESDGLLAFQSEEFRGILEVADNFDVVAKTNGNVSLSLGFGGMVKYKKKSEM